MHGDGGGRHGLIKNANAPKKFLKKSYNNIYKKNDRNHTWWNKRNII